MIQKCLLYKQTHIIYCHVSACLKENMFLRQIVFFSGMGFKRTVMKSGWCHVCGQSSNDLSVCFGLFKRCQKPEVADWNMDFSFVLLFWAEQPIHCQKRTDASSRPVTSDPRAGQSEEYEDSAYTARALTIQHN